MKKKILVTISVDVLAGIDQLAGSRSAVIERVLQRYLRLRTATHARDLKLINGAADRLNREASDVLDY
jgi:hypothetical protein